MTLVRVFDLIDKPIAGRRADIRSRNADGTLRYEHQAQDGPRMVTMERVRVHNVVTKDDRKEQWMRWEWDGKPHGQPLACGYSGCLMDGKREMEYHIEMEEPNGSR